MAASLGATTYSAVTWTAGDVITEAKLDAMVANDQAYDSHAAQGLLVNNAKSFAGKLAGGTNVNLLRITSSDIGELGEEGVNLSGSLIMPRGTLVNGKIVPSVASNNLTVALKTLAGNDPSANDPVYVRIGDTIRKITAALSVTKNAGTNWFNAGSACLATKEIDYFVYLGYNATDGVVIGFARFPYAKEYSQFSTTSANQKYCAISTITNAAAGDDYENIGRFAATLSAGAGYTWTVPTFTNINLIQRPIYESRWLVFASSINGVGGSIGTYATTDYNNHYKIHGEECHLVYYGACSNKGSWSGQLQFLMPFGSATSNYPFDFGYVANNGATWGSGMYGGFYTDATNGYWANAIGTNNVTWADLTAPFTIVLNLIYQI